MGVSEIATAAMLASSPVNLGSATPLMVQPAVVPVSARLLWPVSLSASFVGSTSTGADIQQVPAPPVPANPPSAPPLMPPATAQPSPAEQSARLLPETPDVAEDDITVRARRAIPGDPLAAINATSFAITEAVDNAVLGPAALAVDKYAPKPFTDGLHNFLYNIHEPVAALNFLLQLKPGKAAETLGRFAINSTLGIGGLRDVAKKRPFKLPYRVNGFAYTLGYYGVGPGPYLFLPLIGSTSLRDLIGDNLDRLVIPLSIGRPFNSAAYLTSAGVLRTLDRRADFDDKLRELRRANDPYVARRDYYLQLRQAEIDHLRGNPPPAPAKSGEPPT